MPDLPIVVLPPLPESPGLRWALGQLPPRPWSVGPEHWEVHDARDHIVLRVETFNSRDLAPALAALVNALAPAATPPKGE